MLCLVEMCWLDDDICGAPWDIKSHLSDFVCGLADGLGILLKGSPC